jgi:hypothetical protein
MAAEDIRNLEGGPRHRGWVLSRQRVFLALLGFLRGCDSRSSGLSMPAIMPVATRV